MNRNINELGDLPEEKQKAIYKRIDRKLFKQNKFYLFLHIIRGFFPGLAILAFLEAYYRMTVFQSHSLIIGIVLGIISIAIWLWVEHYKSTQVSEILPEVLAEMDGEKEVATG